MQGESGGAVAVVPLGAVQHPRRRWRQPFEEHFIYGRRARHDVAPAYDMLCTTVYDTRAFAADNAKWPRSELAFSLPEMRTFGDVRGEHVLACN